MPRSRSGTGVVLVMVIAILATLMMAATAFVVVMSEAHQAASNVARLAQAELAARSGIEHALRVIEHATALYVSPSGAVDPSDPTVLHTDLGDADAGWYRYFEPDPADDTVVLSEATKWVPRHDGQDMRGRVYDLPASGTSKRGEYAAYVIDLDGKLHGNIAKWSGGVGSDENGLPASLQPCVKAVAGLCGLPGADRPDAVKQESTGPFYSSINEMARRADLRTVADGKYRLERFFTTYPAPRPGDVSSREISGAPAYTLASNTSVVTLASGALTPGAVIGCAAVFESNGRTLGVIDNDATTLTVRGNCSDQPDGSRVMIVPRPAVNVNTVQEALLVELIKPVCGFRPAVDAQGPKKAEAVAGHICALRPFQGRHEFEEAVRRVTGEDAVGDLHDYVVELPVGSFLSERQFNDLLNSAAGRTAEDESAYDEPGSPGVYSFDGWSEGQSGWIGPSQAGGSRTNGVNVTWSTELKFSSRFFHIYALGHGWAAGKPAGVRRAHAIYDAEADRIVWLRWNLSSRGSVADMGQ